MPLPSSMSKVSGKAHVIAFVVSAIFMFISVVVTLVAEPNRASMVSGSLFAGLGGLLLLVGSKLSARTTGGLADHWRQ